METHKNEPLLHFASSADFDAWLASNHSTVPAIWVKYAKKGSGKQSITYPESRDVALCWGWIDGTKNAIDGQYYTNRFTPRKARSVWSRVNVGVVEELMKQGRMQAPGLAQVEAAKADGRWENAYHSSSTIKVPEDFAERISAKPKAQAFFDALSKTSRYAFLYRLQTAKKPETRERLLKTFVEMLERGEAYHSVMKRNQST